MRVLVAALLCLVLVRPGQAQEPQVHLDLTVEQAMLITAVLGQLGCQTVEQLSRCEKAVELLKTIREQAGKQIK